MSVCRFIASDMPLKEFEPSQEYPLSIDVDKGTIFDGGADDNYHLRAFDSVKDYADKAYGVYLEWNYTDGRAQQIVAYIKTALQQAHSVEFWNVWLMGYYEYEDRPLVHRKTVRAEELTVEHIEEINDAVIWNTPDKMHPERPSFYCLTVTR